MNDTEPTAGCRVIRVTTVEAGKRQYKLLVLRAVAVAFLNEHLAQPQRQPASVPFVAHPDLSGGEIGTRLARLEAKLAQMKFNTVLTDEQQAAVGVIEAELAGVLADPPPKTATKTELRVYRAAVYALRERAGIIRMAGARTPEQTAALTELETQHRTLCAEADSMPRRGGSIGIRGSYVVRIPTTDIWVGTELQRIETITFIVDVNVAPASVRGSHDALEAAYGPGGETRSPVWEAADGQLRISNDLDPLLIRYWWTLSGQAEIDQMVIEMRREGRAA